MSTNAKPHPQPSRIVVVERGGRYVIYGGEPAIVATGATMDEAFHNHLNRRAALEGELREAGFDLEKLWAIDHPVTQGPVWWKEILFRRAIGLAAALMIVGVLIIGAAGVINMGVNKVADIMLGERSPISVNKLEKEIARAAIPKRLMSPEQVEGIRLNLRIILHNIKPIIDEFRILFDEPNGASGTDSADRPFENTREDVLIKRQTE